MNEQKYLMKAHKERRHYTKKELEKMYNPKDTSSARYNTKIGMIIKKSGVTFKLINKKIYPINICPYCSSKDTYHKVQQKTGSNDNVYRTFCFLYYKVYTYTKYDYCLDCEKEFYIETYYYYVMKRLWLLKLINLKNRIKNYGKD